MVSLLIEKQQTETQDGGRTVGEKAGMDHGGGLTICLYVCMYVCMHVCIYICIVHKLCMNIEYRKEVYKYMLTPRLPMIHCLLTAGSQQVRVDHGGGGHPRMRKHRQARSSPRFVKPKTSPGSNFPKLPKI